MKNIFIATDFSTASRDAALYALQLAHVFDARVHLFFGCGTPVKLTSAYDPVDAARIIREAKMKLVKESAELHHNHKINIELYVSDGPVPDAIIENAANCHADIIICGMKQKARSLRKIFGSVVYSLINKASIPLLIVPEGSQFHNPQHIALAADHDPETSPSTLSAMKRIAEKFSSRISVINVLNENYEEKDVRRIQQPTNLAEVAHLYPRYEFPVGDNIAETIHHFAIEKKIDVLAIIPHQRKWMNRLLKQSITKNLVAYTNLPVLVLPQNRESVDDGLARLEQIREVCEKTDIKRDEYHC